MSHPVGNWTSSPCTRRITAGGCSTRTATRSPGGDDHYAAYLENREGYEVELVAPPAS
jgi:hypothetical protein